MNINKDNPFKPNQPKGLGSYKKYTHKDKKLFTPAGYPKIMKYKEREQILMREKIARDRIVAINLLKKDKEALARKLDEEIRLIQEKTARQGIQPQEPRYAELIGDAREIAK